MRKLQLPSKVDGQSQNCYLPSSSQLGWRRARKMKPTSASFPEKVSTYPWSSCIHPKILVNKSSCRVQAFFKLHLCARSWTSTTVSGLFKSESWFPVALRFSQSWAPVILKARHYEGSYSWCRSQGPEVPDMGHESLTPQGGPSHLWYSSYFRIMAPVVWLVTSLYLCPPTLF